SPAPSSAWACWAPGRRCRPRGGDRPTPPRRSPGGGRGLRGRHRGGGAGPGVAGDHPGPCPRPRTDAVGLALAVGLAGGVGAVARYLVDGAVQERTSGLCPFGTLTVNVAGSLILGVVAGGVLGGA